ncbi:MAG: endonuclease MutS2 [Vulcanimicrobiota bacterium]
MNKHSFRILEYETVREIIARKTTNIYGRQAIEKRYPLKELEKIEDYQAQLKEANLLFDSEQVHIIGDLKPIKEYLKMAKKKIPLHPEAIIDINQILTASRLLKNYLSNQEQKTPLLKEGSVVLSINRDFETKVKKSFSEEALLKDSASDKLGQIRREKNTYKNKIQSHLDGILKNPDYLKMLQEPIITRREHRYVVPVKQEYRSKFPGLVLDSSASGATLFMEPTSVLRLTNELKYLESEEKHEEERILLQFSALIAGMEENLLINTGFLGHYDGLQACIRFMIDLDCIIPQLRKKAVLDLKKARHPLLGKEAVPIDIYLGMDFLGLIITGPNTGGKTVTLKTAGLLTMLGLAGFPIPAGDGSTIGMFHQIYADIGDEQSIKQNLSTFSAHISNINKILPHADSKTLVLLDEIGAGTDPSEGVALASGILNYLVQRGTRIIVTTHYNQLKVFASKKQELINAAVQFNEETLEPTYHLLIGLPGRSCALKIARRLGLPDEILRESREIMGSRSLHLDSLLSEIDQEKSRAREVRETIEKDKEKIEKLKEEYDSKLSRVEDDRQAMLDEIINEAESLREELVREIEKAKSEWRNSLKKSSTNLDDRKQARKNERKIKGELDKTIDKLKLIKEKHTRRKIEEKPVVRFEEGEVVKASGIGRVGTIVRIIDDEKAMVQIENLKMEVPLRDLAPMEAPLPTVEKSVRKILRQKALNVSDRLDIRGNRVEEGLEKISKFIDDAFLANLDTITIVHGKGTGVLRNAVKDYLKDHSRIKSYRDGELHEGGWGVTIVKL